MSEQQQQTITPERQVAAQQVGAVFNSLHEYLMTLTPVNEAGERLMVKQLEYAHARIDEAAMWAIKSVLTYGTPLAAAASGAANDTTPPADAPSA